MLSSVGVERGGWLNTPGVPASRSESWDAEPGVCGILVTRPVILIKDTVSQGRTVTLPRTQVPPLPWSEFISSIQQTETGGAGHLESGDHEPCATLEVGSSPREWER